MKKKKTISQIPIRRLRFTLRPSVPGIFFFSQVVIPDQSFSLPCLGIRPICQNIFGIRVGGAKAKAGYRYSFLPKVPYVPVMRRARRTLYFPVHFVLPFHRFTRKPGEPGSLRCTGRPTAYILPQCIALNKFQCTFATNTAPPPHPCITFIEKRG